MKYIVPMVLLTMLSACNGGKNKSVYKVSQEVNAAISDIHVGQKSKEVVTGPDYEINSSDLDATPTSLIVTSVTEKIVLKVEGGKVYRYEKKTNEGVTSASITIDQVPRAKDVSALVRRGGRVNGLDYSYEFPVRDAYISYELNDADQVVISGNRKQSSFGKFSSGACEFNLSEVGTNMKYAVNGVVKGSLPDLLETRVGTCEGTASRDELKALNLSDITVCDNTLPPTADFDCEFNQNMSHLTADL